MGKSSDKTTPAISGASSISPVKSWGSDAASSSASQAESDATSFATSHGYKVMGVKNFKLHAKSQKVYYEVKLQLGQNSQNSHKHGTMNVWVDASTAAGTVTAASGDGLHWKAGAQVMSSSAVTDAEGAVSGTEYKVSLHGGKWKWYWVFIRDGSTKYKVAVDAASGVVTQVHAS